MRYRCLLSRLSSVCSCGATYDLQHNLSCEKGGFVKKRHNKLRNITAQLLTLLCNDVKLKLEFKHLAGENLASSPTNMQGATSGVLRVRTYARKPKRQIP